MNHSDAEPSLESLIERSGDLKRALVDFACGPRLERHLTRFMQKSVSPGDVLDEGPTLKDILPQGAVLEFHGTTFLLPAY